MTGSRYIMVLCLSFACLGTAIPQSRSRQAAEHFFARKLSENGIPANFRFDEPVREGNILIYECQYPAGFVLVRESDSCRIVGYSIRNLFTRNKIIPAPASTFIESLSQHTGPDSSIRRLKSTYHPVGPLIRTTWSQEGFFNYYCPEDPQGPDNHVYAGCAAVAMGQIIRFFGKFNDFELTASMEDYNYGKMEARIGNYDWERMENRPITLDTEVSRFLFGLGVMTAMNWGASGSTTSNYKVYDSFKKLKYFDAIRMMRTATNPDVWTLNFTQNIEDYQPVYVSGTGHSFICDGIDAQGMFHFNLGWYGYADGYYPLNQVMSIDPGEAIFNLGPYSNNLPPANFILDTVDGRKQLKWEKHRLATIDPLLYRIYLNDSTVYETRETTFSTGSFPPGNHEIMVTAVYPQGESRWIGPISLPVEGNPVPIPDLALKLAIEEELTRENVNPVNDPPTMNQLLKISKIELRQPVQSLAGLEQCHNIQVLVIAPEVKTSLYLGPVSLLRRLKSLDLKNIEPTSLELLANNNRIIHLSMINSPAGDLNFLTALIGLISLNFTGLPVTDTQIFNSLLSLKELTLSGCNISNAAFAQGLGNLEYLDLSDNLLLRFRLNAKLPELHLLNLSHNQINDLFFLEYIPNIAKLNLGNNQISRFITGLDFKYLRELNLENNSIDSLGSVLPMPLLSTLKVNHNKVRDVGLLKDFAPALINLDLAGNRIRNFWKGSLQSLENLDFSNNQLDLINDLTSNPLLKHINLSHNSLTDLYPLFNHLNSSKIQFLDMTGNPLSVESAGDLSSFLRTVIDTLILPDNPQEFSPGSPLPLRNHAVTGQNAVLSWQSAALPSGGSFEVFTGRSRDSLKMAGRVQVPVFEMDIKPGHRYFWRVHTNLPDTAYLSGLFSFVTTEPFTLPYKEDFEGYTAFDYFTEKSPLWIRASDVTSSPTDGRIDSYRRSEGKQSLKLMNSSDLHLPLGHLYQSVMYISMQLLIGDGCLASFRLNDINGANLELYFKSNGRCDIILNSRLQSEVPFRTAEWFPLQVNLYSKGSQIWLKIGSTDVQLDWNFTGEVVHTGELELASEPGPNWPTDGQPLFHADNLEIKESGSVSSQVVPMSNRIIIYPNPADDYVYIRTEGLSFSPDIRIFDLSGKMMEPVLSTRYSGIYIINTSNLAPGIYVIRVSGPGITSTEKICITR